jgi:F-box protein 18 (helicase)
MQLTQEQSDIINSTGNIKINAVAGSGKTTTIIEYARTRPTNCRILYLAFNRSVKLEAKHKFSEKGLTNVQVETAHSLAYKHVVLKNNYKVRSQGFKINEIVEILNLQGNEEKHTEYIIANHISKFFLYYCNSTASSIKDLNYLDVIESKAKNFVEGIYNYLEKQTQAFINLMENGKIEISHDFYLKKFQLSDPTLNYDYILFDEGQDASPVILDVFMKQNATKVIVGDAHQQIYSWRFAVNSLEKVDFKTYYLSTSFRFSQDIANLALKTLKLKTHLQKDPDDVITGKGESKSHKVKAVLARTNLGLLLKAIEYVTEKKVNHIYFEGNINSYTYADDGASLYDVLNLYNGKHGLIRDKLIRSMKNIRELEAYVEKTEDPQLGMMIEIVKEYGNEIPKIIRQIKEKHVADDEKDKAEMIFSTVHRSKGMEYDSIQLVNDFITEEKILKQVKDKKNKELNFSKLNEEINLLYVAITRTKNTIHIPETLVSPEFPSCPQIYVMREVIIEEDAESTPEEEMIREINQRKDLSEKTYSLDAIREKHKEAYKPWTTALDEELSNMYLEGIHVKDLAKHFGRTRGAINSRLQKLELIEA